MYFYYKVTGLFGLFFQIITVVSRKECGVLSNNQNSVLPWTVNIYQYNNEESITDNNFVCSGTVISSKIILTAARCFYDEVNQKININSSFVLTVGQTSKTWNSNANYKILPSNILIPKQYKGQKTKYAYDIAIIKLNPNQKLNTDKVPCIYWDNEFVESELEVNLTPLKVISWTKTNDAFTELEPAYINFDICYNLVTQAFQKFLVFDKMCSQIEGSHVITNLGSGLFALNTVNNRWYLIGISCETTIADSKVFMSSTKIQTHLNWISNHAFLDVD